MYNYHCGFRIGWNLGLAFNRGFGCKLGRSYGYVFNCTWYSKIVAHFIWSHAPFNQNWNAATSKFSVHGKKLVGKLGNKLLRQCPRTIHNSLRSTPGTLPRNGNARAGESVVRAHLMPCMNPNVAFSHSLARRINLGDVAIALRRPIPISHHTHRNLNSNWKRRACVRTWNLWPGAATYPFLASVTLGW